MIKTISWDGDTVVMIDQRALPREERCITCRNYHDVTVAIRDMAIRGAPAVGIAAAMGIALGMLNSSGEHMKDDFSRICDEFSRTRPTAVNLFWAIDRMKARFDREFASTPENQAGCRKKRPERRSPAYPRGRYPCEPADGNPGTAPYKGRGYHPDALQCRSTGDRRLWNGAWGYTRRP